MEGPTVVLETVNTPPCTSTRVEAGTCRCCLALGDFKSMESTLSLSGRAQSYVDMLREVFALTLAPVAAVPLICDICAVRLCQAFIFKNQIMESEESFLKVNTTKIKIEKDHIKETIYRQTENEQSPSLLDEIARVIRNVRTMKQEKLRQGIIRNPHSKSEKHTNNKPMSVHSSIWVSELTDFRPKRTTCKNNNSRKNTHLSTIFQAKRNDYNTVETEAKIENKLGILQSVTNAELMDVENSLSINKLSDVKSEPLDKDPLAISEVQESVTDEKNFSADTTVNMSPQTVETKIEDAEILISLGKETNVENNNTYIDNSSKGDVNVERTEANTIEDATNGTHCLDDTTVNMSPQTVETKIKDAEILISLGKETNAENNNIYIDNSSERDDNVERNEANTVEDATNRTLCMCCYEDGKDFSSHKLQNTCEIKMYQRNCLYCNVPISTDSKVISEHMRNEHKGIERTGDKRQILDSEESFLTINTNKLNIEKNHTEQTIYRQTDNELIHPEPSMLDEITPVISNVRRVKTKKQYKCSSHLKCATCKKTFRNVYQRDKHALCHRPDIPCSVCDETFLSKITREKHIKKVHGYKCLQCNQRFTSHAMIKHKIEAHGAPKWDCQACDRTFNTNTKLITHQRKDHMLERNKQCPHCDYKAYCTARLKRHIIKHTKERKFMCRYCSKSFARARNLVVHERIHTGDKRQVCKFCQKAFVQRASLKYHLEFI